MRPLRLALIRQRYTHFGGAERLVSNAIQALSAEGASLTVVTRRWEASNNHDHLICNPPYLGSLWRDWSFARCVCGILKKHSFDLVQSHERIACCDVFRAGDGVHREWLAQRRRVLGSLGRLRLALNPYHHYVLAAEKKLFASPRLKAVICISRMVKDDIQRHYSVPDDKLHIIYNGVDTTHFHPTLAEKHRQPTRSAFGIPPGAPLFLFVGSGFQRKGLAVVLRALAQLPESTHLLVVGKDKQMKTLIQAAEQLGLAGQVHFAGGQKDVRPFYGAADALAFPTLYEPFGNVALEAMACGLPVITSSKSGAAELIREGENGFICDPLDHRQLATAMTKLLSPTLRQSAGLAARATVEPMTLEAMGARWLALYRQLLYPLADRV
jgi:UDP-glucose:(heptosyl)LPS alpha-1,3-glucosyltransferase